MHLHIAGATFFGTVATNFVARLNNGGNTFVNGNTSGGLEAIASANMKIEILGNASLSAANFIHL